MMQNAASRGSPLDIVLFTPVVTSSKPVTSDDKLACWPGSWFNAPDNMENSTIYPAILNIVSKPFMIPVSMILKLT